MLQRASGGTSKALLIPPPGFPLCSLPRACYNFIGIMDSYKPRTFAITETVRKLGAVVLAFLVFTVFTAEYRHLVDESVEHLLGHNQNSADSSRGNLTHRCHNCVTSQPQGETVRWDYQPNSTLALFTVEVQVPSTGTRPLLRLPANRAPPAS